MQPLALLLPLMRWRPVLVPLGLTLVALGLVSLPVAAAGSLVTLVGLHGTLVTVRYSPRARRFWARMLQDPIEAARHPG